MIHNGIHHVLRDFATQQGWDDESCIIHLTGFLNNLPGPRSDEGSAASMLSTDGTLSHESLLEAWRIYLQAVANEENAFTPPERSEPPHWSYRH